MATWRQPKKANVDGQGKDFSEFNTRVLIHTDKSKRASLSIEASQVSEWSDSLYKGPAPFAPAGSENVGSQCATFAGDLARFFSDADRFHHADGCTLLSYLHKQRYVCEQRRRWLISANKEVRSGAVSGLGYSSPPFIIQLVQQTSTPPLTCAREGDS